MPDQPGIAFAILGPVADANIDVDMIIQNASHEGLTDFSFTVHRNDFKRAMEILEAKVKPAIGARGIVGDDKIAKVSLVGVGMRTHAGIAAQDVRRAAEEGINIQMISTSEIKISVVVDEKYMELAVRALHQAFELDKPPTRGEDEAVRIRAPSHCATAGPAHEAFCRPRHGRTSPSDDPVPLARGRDRREGAWRGPGAEREEQAALEGTPEFKPLHERLLADLQLARAHPRRREARRLVLQLLAGREEPARPLAAHDARGVPQAASRRGRRCSTWTSSPPPRTRNGC